MRIIWLLIGIISTVCGIAGVVLPLVPTTPFLLLAAFCFARSSPRLHAALLSHRHFGPIIQNWNRDGSIDSKSKALALGVMAACIMISLYLQIPNYILFIQIMILGAVAVFIVTRPSGPVA